MSKKLNIHRYESIDHACDSLKATVLLQGSYVSGELKVNVVKLQSKEDPHLCYYISRIGNKYWIKGATPKGIISLYKKW